MTTEDGGVTWSPASAPASALTVAAVHVLGARPTAPPWSARAPSCGPPTAPTSGRPGNQRETSPRSSSPATISSAAPAARASFRVTCPTATATGEGAVALSTERRADLGAGHGPGGNRRAPERRLPQRRRTASRRGPRPPRSATSCRPRASSCTAPTEGTPGRSAHGPTAVDDVYGLACPSAEQCAMVGTKWIGFPAIALGAVAQSVNGGATFKSSPLAYVPITLTAVDLSRLPRRASPSAGTPWPASPSCIRGAPPHHDDGCRPGRRSDVAHGDTLTSGAPECRKGAAMGCPDVTRAFSDSVSGAASLVSGCTPP